MVRLIIIISDLSLFKTMSKQPVICCSYKPCHVLCQEVKTISNFFNEETTRLFWLEIFESVSHILKLYLALLPLQKRGYLIDISKNLSHMTYSSMQFELPRRWQGSQTTLRFLLLDRIKFRPNALHFTFRKRYLCEHDAIFGEVNSAQTDRTK